MLTSTRSIPASGRATVKSTPVKSIPEKFIHEALFSKSDTDRPTEPLTAVYMKIFALKMAPVKSVPFKFPIESRGTNFHDEVSR